MSSLMRFVGLSLALSCLFISAIYASSSTNSSAPAPATRPAAVRIGVYDSRTIALVWARSAKVGDTILKLSTEGKEAQAAGDQKRAAEIRDQMTRLQFNTHVQVFASATPEEALAILQPDLPAIAREARVSAIVDRLDYQGPGIETVDLTETLMAHFDPSPEVKRTALELRKVKPASLYDAAHADD